MFALASDTLCSSCATARERSVRACFVKLMYSLGASSRASWCGCVGVWSAFVMSCRLRLRRSRARMGSMPTQLAFCQRPIETSTSWKAFQKHLAREVYEPGLKGLLTRLLGEEALRAEIRRAPCSLPALGVGSDSVVGLRRGRWAPGSHHAYLGGLLEHTVAVATMALELCMLHPRLDRDLLLSAAIVHDLGKTREFTYGAEIERSARGQTARAHRAGPASARRSHSGHARRRAQACARALRDPSPRRRRRRGQRFASREALALYRLNALDAQVKGAFEQGAYPLRVRP